VNGRPPDRPRIVAERRGPAGGWQASSYSPFWRSPCSAARGRVVLRQCALFESLGTAPCLTRSDPGRLSARSLWSRSGALGAALALKPARVAEMMTDDSHHGQRVKCASDQTR